MQDIHLVTITREQGYIVDRLRSYNVFLDGERMFQIYEGEFKQITMSPGVHSLSLRVDWCRSRTLTFDASSGESTALWCWPSARAYTLPIFLTLWWDRYIAVSNQPNAERAPRKTWFRLYQFIVLMVLIAFVGYESIQGKIVTLVLLIPLLVIAIVWFRQRRSRSSPHNQGANR
jgi:hypothetical protein